MTLSDSIHRHVAAYLRGCLTETAGNVKAAARIADLHRSQFYRECARYGVDIDSHRIRPTPHRVNTRLIGEWARL